MQEASSGRARAAAEYTDAHLCGLVRTASRQHGMDLVAHCGEVNRGSYVNSLVLTDIASGWTEAAPLVVRKAVSW